jgi:hypothetical protein
MKIRLHPGKPPDYERLMRFYARERSANLPTPTVKDLTTALTDGRFLIAESEDGEIRACAAQIPLTTHSLSCLRRRVDRHSSDQTTQPWQANQLSDPDARFARAAPCCSLGRGSAACFEQPITIIKKENIGSLKNVRRAKFVDCEERPDWLRFDELSWHGDYVVDEWEYLLATSESVRYLADKLISNGFSKVNEHRHGVRPTEIALDGFRDLAVAQDDIRHIALGRRTIDLAPLPERLIFLPEASADDIIEKIQESVLDEVTREICRHLGLTGLEKARSRPLQ